MESVTTLLKGMRPMPPAEVNSRNRTATRTKSKGPLLPPK